MKKKFIKPSMKALALRTENLMTGSGSSTGTETIKPGTGPQPGAADARKNKFIKEDLF